MEIKPETLKIFLNLNIEFKKMFIKKILLKFEKPVIFCLAVLIPAAPQILYIPLKGEIL